MTRLERVVLAALGAVAAWVRLDGRHAGLPYPDGYQYLLMARGYAEHLRPLTTLGPGGDPFAPSADAALKPLFPALVAVADRLGAEPRAAAGVVAALAAAAVVPLVAAVALRLTGSLAAAVAAAGFVLASPAVAFHAGFAGPDALGQALALCAALALLGGRSRTGGALAALAALARPELAALAAGAALAAALDPRLRAPARRGAEAGAVVLAVALAVLRPPLVLDLRLLGGLAALTALSAAAIAAAGVAARRRSTAIMGAAAAALAVAAVRPDAAAGLVRAEWPLALVGALGLAAACAGPGRRPALAAAAAGLVLGAAYAVRNPGSERYAALLVPAVALVVALGLAHLPRALRLVPAALLLAAAALVPGRVDPGAGQFAALAAQLPETTVVSAAADAYSVERPGLAFRVAAPGVGGLVLVDGALRAYEPGLVPRGRTVARLRARAPFLRPDGTLDPRDALLVRTAR